jgi:hypothetical protein
MSSGRLQLATDDAPLRVGRHITHARTSTLTVSHTAVLVVCLPLQALRSVLPCQGTLLLLSMLACRLVCLSCFGVCPAIPFFQLQSCLSVW